MMKGTVNVTDLMTYLRENDLVIAPAATVRVDRENLRRNILAKRMATFNEISESHIWEAITYHRVAQLVAQHCAPEEVVTVKKGDRTVKKVVRAAIMRIARMRGVNLGE